MTPQIMVHLAPQLLSLSFTFPSAVFSLPSPIFPSLQGSLPSRDLRTCTCPEPIYPQKET